MLRKVGVMLTREQETALLEMVTKGTAPARPTPVHGSWLNMVEIENSVLSRACLARRIPTTEALRDTVRPWQDQRNADSARIQWRFTVDSARQKFNRFYPAHS